jgi:hypothetical protein
MTEEPYWVRDYREHQEREAAHRAARNSPPAKSTTITPLLNWDRTITWWPKYDWERYDRVTSGNDLSPADQGYKLRGIRDMALLGEDADGFAITSVEVTYSTYICDECPQECGYIILHKADTPEEECVCEDGFTTIDQAREAATQALAAILVRDAG